MEPQSGDRPSHCSVAYVVELALREGNCWEGVIPCNMKDLTGWLGSMPYRKQQLERALQEADGDLELEEVVRLEHQAQLEQKAQHVLNELTVGFAHAGQDSMIRPDYRFKRTNNGNLYIGAGNILAAIKEAAWFKDDNPGWKRRLQGKLYISPGKIVMYRYDEQTGKRVGITRADGRNQRQVPPEPPSPKNMFRGKPATLVFAERVRSPANLHFTLWTAPDVDGGLLESWLEIAGELGILKYRQQRQGQFNTVKFHPASPEQTEEFRRREVAKRS